MYDVECDVFAPCALGGVINDDTVGRLKAKIVCGSANNQLLEERHAAALAERNILYAPDFVANGGGVINVAASWLLMDMIEIAPLAKVSTIFDIMLSILQVSKEEGIGTK